MAEAVRASVGSIVKQNPPFGVWARGTRGAECGFHRTRLWDRNATVGPKIRRCGDSLGFEAAAPSRAVIKVECRGKEWRHGSQFDCDTRQRESSLWRLCEGGGATSKVLVSSMIRRSAEKRQLRLFGGRMSDGDLEESRGPRKNGEISANG